MPQILVIQSNGAYSYCKRKQAEGVVDRGRATWNRSRTVITMRKSTDDKPAIGYEYGGKQSYCAELTREAIDSRTGGVVQVPIEVQDRTRIPVVEPSGATVLQLKLLMNRRTHGRHITVQDRLWRPERKKPKAVNTGSNK